MPLTDLREQQTRSWARQHFAAESEAHTPPGEHWSADGQARWLAQGVLWLALGVEVGYFDRRVAETYLDRTLDSALTERLVPGLGDLLDRESGGDGEVAIIDPIDDVLPARAAARVRQVLADSFVATADRPPIARSDAALLAFRAALAPVSRLAAVGAPVIAFLEHAISGADRPAFTDPADGDGSDDGAWPVALDAFAYLRDVVEALSFVAEERAVPPQLAAEIGLIYRTQLDLSRRHVRAHLESTATAMVVATAASTRALLRTAEIDGFTAGWAEGALTPVSARWQTELRATLDAFTRLTTAARRKGGGHREMNA